MTDIHIASRTVAGAVLGALLALGGCPATPADEGEGGADADVEADVAAPFEGAPIVFVRAAAQAPAEGDAAADPAEGDAAADEPAPSPEVVQAYPVGTANTDVREMLTAVETGKRAEIPIPEAFGDLKIAVGTSWFEVVDLDGNGHADKLLYRWATIPHEYEPTIAVAWVVAVLAAADGTIGPDQEKAGVLVDAMRIEGDTPPLGAPELVAGETPAVRYGRWDAAAGALAPWQATVVAAADAPPPDVDRDVALVRSAMAVYDAGVLAPEMAYVKAFIRKEFLPEVEAVESTRDMMFPEVLAPLYTAIKQVEHRLGDTTLAGTYTEAEPHLAVMTGILVHEGDLRLSLSADELTRRVAGLQQLGEQFEAIEATLQLDGEKARRRDFELKLGQIADADERAAVTKAYQDAFRPMVAADGDYPKFIDEMNAIARAHGYRNYADMRLVEKFGLDLAGFQQWVDQTWAQTDADAQAYIDALEQFAGAETLTYWQVGQLSEAWILDQVGMEELPALSEADAHAVLRQMYKDVGFDMAAAPYDAITQDWYQDDLKWNRAGTAATANPQQAYFTSNLKKGEPIPLDEWETTVHELGHDLHYQTSGATVPGLSSYQNNMPSYVAEGVAMTFETIPVGNETLMRRYFDGKPGFTDKLFEVYPDVKKQAAAWQTRRLLLMAMYEIGLYVDQDADGNAIPWETRVGAWDEMVRTRLFVEPPADALAQIMCRSHPFNDQSQLGYASYSLGYSLVVQIQQRTIAEGSDAELQRFGATMKRVMADGAVADRTSVQAVVDAL